MNDPLDKAPAVPLDEVEWRVDGKPTENKTARFVPYVDATTTARLLDEWVGPGNWSDAYESRTLADKEALECALSIKVGDEWVTKRDVGVPSNFEAQKGLVSDAFKRVACIKWGIARNVYSLPTLWAPCRVDSKGNAWPNDKTLPTIHRELKKLGYEASGRLSASVEQDETSPEAHRPQSSKPQTGQEVSGAPLAGSTPAPAGNTEPQASLDVSPSDSADGGGVGRGEGSVPTSSAVEIPPAQDLVEEWGDGKVLATARRLAKVNNITPSPMRWQEINEPLARLVGKDLKKKVDA